MSAADGSDDKKGHGPVGSTHDEKHAPHIQIDNAISNINVKLANPLEGLSHEELMASGVEFARTHGLGHLEEVFKKGALAAQDPLAFENVPYFTEDDKNIFRRELTHRWDHPGTLYYLMDQAGASLFFAPQFHIDTSTARNASQNEWLLGLSHTTIFFCAALSFLTCIWQGPRLFVARFFLGLGIGPKSSPVPRLRRGVFPSCDPWCSRHDVADVDRLWYCFGIMLGYVADLAFYKVPDKPHIKGLNWRPMLASAGVPALFLAAQVFFCLESPRWLISKGRYPDAPCAGGPGSLLSDSSPDIHVLLEAEKELTRGRSRYPPSPATVARPLDFIVMFIEIRALLASWGFGALNFVMALPAVYTIDTFGRRNLLLVTFPLMSLFLLMTGFAFWIPEGNGQIAVVALGIYLFDCVYSPGEGPVPFPYAAESFPLYIRDVGINFVVAITFLRLLGAFKLQGAFGWYAAWNVVGFFAILLFVPETKALSLEELDQVLVFSVPTQTHAAYQIRALPHNIKKYIFRMKVDPLPPLYEHDGAIGEKHIRMTSISRPNFLRSNGGANILVELQTFWTSEIIITIVITVVVEILFYVPGFGLRISTISTFDLWAPSPPWHGTTLSYYHHTLLFASLKNFRADQNTKHQISFTRALRSDEGGLREEKQWHRPGQPCLRGADHAIIT
ncbi:MFS sugar transporter [Lactarius pseudohatsudake]|nr:MFS sugar transporter [Lactarius pseudohatsudake]